MSNDKRIFEVTPPEMTPEMISGISTVRDGPHLELFYNLIFDEIGFTLPDHLRPVVWAMADKSIDSLMVIISPGSGKSQLSGIAYPLWELGLDQNLTIMGVSGGADLMVGWLQTTMNIIEHSKVYHLLFNKIKPDKDQGWSTSRGAFIKRTISSQANPSYEALGYGSKKIVGKHAKLIIVDDIHDDENSATSDQIEKVEEFYYRTLVGRADPQGTRMIMIGRRWAADDLYGRLIKASDWLTMTLANFRDGEELYYEVRIPAGLSCVFNDYTPKDVVEDIKVKYGENVEPKGFFWTGSLGKPKYKEAVLIRKNKPEIFETVYQSNPESAANKIFRKEDFRDFTIPDYTYMGRNYDVVTEFLAKLDLDLLIQSWDTAMTSESQNDPSVGYTAGLKGCTKDHRSQEPNPAEIPFHYDIYILDEFYGRFNMGDLKNEVVEYHNIWRPNYVLVENSVAGVPIIQDLQSYGIQVVPVQVRHISKRSRATNGADAGSAQGWSRQGNILVPRKYSTGLDVGWATSLLNELDDFTGAKGKRDDRVDALVQLANFAINLGVQTRELPEGWRTTGDIDEKMKIWNKPVHLFDTFQQMFDRVRNPFYGLCGSCVNFENNYCKLHKMSVPKLSTCPFYEPDSEETGSIVDIEYGKQEGK